MAFDWGEIYKGYANKKFFHSDSIFSHEVVQMLDQSAHNLPNSRGGIWSRGIDNPLREIGIELSIRIVHVGQKVLSRKESVLRCDALFGRMNKGKESSYVQSCSLLRKISGVNVGPNHTIVGVSHTMMRIALARFLALVRTLSTTMWKSQGS